AGPLSWPRDPGRTVRGAQLLSEALPRGRLSLPMTPAGKKQTAPGLQWRGGGKEKEGKAPGGGRAGGGGGGGGRGRGGRGRGGVGVRGARGGEQPEEGGQQGGRGPAGGLRGRWRGRGVGRGGRAGGCPLCRRPLLLILEWRPRRLCGSPVSRRIVLRREHAGLWCWVRHGWCTSGYSSYYTYEGGIKHWEAQGLSDQSGAGSVPSARVVSARGASSSIRPRCWAMRRACPRW